MALREAAVKRGLHVSEYGILDDATGETLRCATEEEVYARLGLPWIPPELREGRGELEAAAAGRAARARRRSRTCAATCTRTRRSPTATRTSRRWSRARASAATSTSRSPTTRRRTASATTSTPTTLRAQIERVRALNAELDGFDAADRHGDQHPARRLARLRRTSCWPSSTGSSPPCTRRSAMSEEEMTARMVAAIEHPLVDVIGHPTGRKIETRAPYALDVEQRDRGGRAHRHDARDQRGARPPRPQRGPRARGRRGRRADRGRLRRALGPQPRADALRRRDRAARVADAGAGGEHAPVGGAARRCASGAAPPHERRAFRAGVRAGLPFALAGGLLAMSFGVLARDVGMPAWARGPDVGDRVRRLGADRRARRSSAPAAGSARRSAPRR